MTDPLSRRQVNQLLVSGVLSVGVVATPGCLPLLLRLVLGRAALSRIGLATRSSRLASALVFGRGIAIGSRLGRIRASKLPLTQIVDKDGKPVATSKSENGSAAIYVNKSKVFYSRDMPYGQEHHSFGPVGRSINISQNVVRHEDNDGRRLGYDHLRLAKNVIEHFDDRESKVGETILRIDGQNANIIPDKKTIQSIEAIEKALGLDCPRSRAAYQDLTETRRRCGQNDEAACDAVRFKATRYRDLGKECVRNRKD